MKRGRYTGRILGAVVFMAATAGLFTGCTGLGGMFRSGGTADSGTGGSGDNVAASIEAERGPKLPPFTHGYSRQEMLRALVQLNELRESVDYIRDYFYGDVLFEDYLASIIWLETEPYFAGQGVTLAFYDDDGNPYHRITRGWAEGFSGDDGGGYIWKMDHETFDLSFDCEVRTDADRIPREVRVKNLKSGETIRRDTFYADMVGKTEVKEGGTAQNDQAAQWFESLRREEYQSKISSVYAAMDIVGEESVLIAGRWVRAVKMSSSPEPSRDTLVGWFSPDISGKVLKISRGDGSLIAQVVTFQKSLPAEIYRK